MAIAELTIRDWMVIVGVLLILAVLLDAWRRVSRDRRAAVRMKLVDQPEEEPGRAVDISWLKELPNGGARVVERGHRRGRAEAEQEQPAPAPQRRAPEPEPEPEPTAIDEDPVLEGFSAGDDDHEPSNIDWLADAEPDEAQPATAADEPGRLPRDIDPEVFMLNVVARDSRGFRGEDILHILLACDLRFGDMNFFHRHEREAGRGAIQFSVANMMQPGQFDIDNMGEFNTPGLVFFLTLPGPENMIEAYDCMLETARTVSRNLGGDVLDETRSVLTRQSIEHSRQQIRDLERRMLARAR